MLKAMPHIGVCLIVLGVTVSSYNYVEKDIILKVGDNVNIHDSKILFNKILEKDGPNYISDVAEFIIFKNEIEISKLYPEKRIFYVSNTPMTETAIYVNTFFDIYIALGRNFGNDMWSCKIYYKPFIRFIWFGGIIIVICVLFRGWKLLRNNVYINEKNS